MTTFMADQHPARTIAASLLAVALILAALVPGLAGAQAATPAPSGASTEHHLTWDGTDRLYRLYVPEHVMIPAPLVVMMHGGFGSAAQAERAYGWDALADREGFVVAYPNGDGKAWNAGSCCGQPAATGVDDVGFIEAMVKEIEASMPIDASRIYAAGMSNGAMMAYRLACESTLFAAVAPVSGTMMVDCAKPSPVSVIHIHGLADTNVPFDGSRGEGFAQVDGPAVPQVISFWRQEDACATPTETIDGDVTTSIAACADGRAVELISIAGAGHQWPRTDVAPSFTARRGADAPFQGLDATPTIWDFFAAHPKT
ncbi:MAG: PHB depolymerase family esterase [Thermomicrobiales bacterium]